MNLAGLPANKGNIMESREAGIERLYPKIWGRMAARFYYLRELRRQLEKVISLFVKNSPHQLLVSCSWFNFVPFYFLPKTVPEAS